MMIWIDYIVLVYLVAHIVSGLRKGLFAIVINAMCFLVALVLSFYTYEYTANYLVSSFSLSESYANVVGFFANMIIFKILAVLLIRRIFFGKIFRIGNNFLNRISGATVSLAYGTIIVSLLFSIALSFSLPFFVDKQIRSSVTGQIVSADPLRVNDEMKKIFGGVLSSTIDIINFMTVEENEADKRIDLGFRTGDYSVRESVEEEMLKLINGERRSKGLDEYVIDEGLTIVARKHAAEMFENGYFSHTNMEGEKPAERMKKGGVKFNFSGENLAYSENLLSAHNGLMNSENHKKNILHPLFHRIGIGILDAGVRGMMFVQNFAD